MFSVISPVLWLIFEHENICFAVCQKFWWAEISIFYVWFLLRQIQCSVCLYAWSFRGVGQGRWGDFYMKSFNNSFRTAFFFNQFIINFVSISVGFNFCMRYHTGIHQKQEGKREYFSILPSLCYVYNSHSHILMLQVSIRMLDAC